MRLLLMWLVLIGAAQAQHGIKVSWTQSTGCQTACTITKNTVYSAPSAAGPFTAVFTSTTPITSYLDPLTTTNQGLQACYEVSAWTTIESPLSSPAVCQTFPVQAGAPGAVQAVQQ
jgi:hypothetical protein